MRRLRAARPSPWAPIVAWLAAAPAVAAVTPEQAEAMMESVMIGSTALLVGCDGLVGQAEERCE